MILWSAVITTVGLGGLSFINGRTYFSLIWDANFPLVLLHIFGWFIEDCQQSATCSNLDCNVTFSIKQSLDCLQPTWEELGHKELTHFFSFLSSYICICKDAHEQNYQMSKPSCLWFKLGKNQSSNHCSSNRLIEEKVVVLTSSTNGYSDKGLLWLSIFINLNFGTKKKQA